MSDLIERAKGALEGATEGPWSVGRDNTFGPQGRGVGVIVAACPHHEAEYNASLSALAPDLARALIRECEAADRLAEAVSNDAWRTDEEKAALAAYRAAQKEKNDE